MANVRPIRSHLNEKNHENLVRLAMRYPYDKTTKIITFV